MKKVIYLYCSLFLTYSINCSFNPFLTAHAPEIAVIIPSYNNARYYHRNLESVVHQESDLPFSVIYIDDCSSDQTGQLVDAYVKDNKLEQLVKVIHNPARMGGMANLYNVIHTLPDHMIVVLLDGDDWLLHNRALARIAQEYKNKNTWFAYSQMIYLSGGVVGSKALAPDTIQQNSFRDAEWVTRHIKTFYAGLFKRIKINDLLYNNTFYPMAWDFACIFPMLEMAAHNHIAFIPEVLYVYNDCNSICDHFKDGHKQLMLGQSIRKKEKYSPLYQEKYNTADLVIFSFDRPLQLYALLESIEKYVVGLGQIQVIYRTSDNNYAQAYDTVMKDFSHVIFHHQGENPLEDFRPLTLHALFESPNDYIMLAVDDIIVKDFISIADDIALLKKHNAYGFFYRLGTHLSYCHPRNCAQALPPFENPEPSIIKWCFCQGQGDWAYPNNMDMTLYAKKDIKEELYSIPLANPSAELYWDYAADKVKERHGLCYASSKIVNIPLNRVQNICENPHMGVAKEYLLEQFNKGLKIDITPFYRIKNNGAHTEYAITFIAR